ncbi:MAG TPA: porphobilinogen synthase [Bacillota bacterium]|nr:porphobilinogen synthase [Bacillota bacterium]
MDLIQRPRRLRTGAAIRQLVRETSISIGDFIYPLFVKEEAGKKREIPSMPKVYQLSLEHFLEELAEIKNLGIPGVLLFGIPEVKDEVGSRAYARDGIIQKALRLGKERFPELLFIADVCLCEYTSHGHCGIVKDGEIINDASVDLMVKTALSYAEAGADILALSDMMDGRVGALRKALDRKGYIQTIVMAYGDKYASAFYGPLRGGAQSKPAFGNRQTYQMDYDAPIGADWQEALREVEQDIAEGADIVMIKPALAYLDIVREISSRFPVPVAVYHVSSEYSLIKAAANKGWLDEKSVVLESITRMKRAGAKIIISFFAKDLARWLQEV